MAVGAHPDDVEFGAGATLARWAAAGAEVTIVVMTDGSKGTWDRNLDPAELVAARRREQQAAAAVLGAAGVLMLDRVDGELAYSMELRELLCRHIRTLRPDLLLTHDPWQRYQLHPDHRATGRIVLDGMVAARDHLFYPEQVAAGLEPHRPAAVLLWSADEPDHWEDAGPGLETKVEALLRHSTQAPTTMADAHRDVEARAAFAARIADWARRSGEPAGLEAAEAFKRLTP